MKSGEKRFRRSVAPRAAGAIVATTALLLLASTPASATTATTAEIDFGAYATGAGTPVGQNGWWWGGTSTADYDIEIADNADHPAAGLSAGRSLRISNSTMSSAAYGLVGQLISPAIERAGGAASAALLDTFETSFTVASTTGALQEGLSLAVGPTTGGNRAGGFLGLRHIPAGLQLWLTWVPADATGTEIADWRTVAAVVAADVPHRIRMVSHFADGDADYVTVSVDGEPILSGHTWADYYRIQDGTSRAVDSLIFRISSSVPDANGIGYATQFPTAEQNAALDGEGLLFSDIEYSTYQVAPGEEPALPLAPTPTPDAEIAVSDAPIDPGVPVVVEIPGFAPYEDVYFAWYSTPVFGGWFQADGAGVVRASIVVPASLPDGPHTLQATGARSGFTAAASVVVRSANTAPADEERGLADTGLDAPLFAGAAFAAAGLGLGLVLLSLRRRVRRPRTAALTRRSRG